MVALDPKQLQRDVLNVVESLTGMATEARPQAGPLQPAVHITMVMVIGEVEFAVRLYCPDALAVSLSSAMFMVEPSEVSPADVQDAMGEIVNVTAGRVQAYLPGSSDLTVPCREAGTGVFAEDDSELCIHATCQGHPILVTIHRQES